MEQLLEKARLEYFFNNSQNRRLRRKMAKELGLMKKGWQNIKEEFTPYNKPKDFGINRLKRELKESALSTSDQRKAVVQYKSKVRENLVSTSNPKED